MTDPNNRPGGPNLIVTAKTAHKVHFLDAATLATTATIDMPGSTHEIALSPDGRYLVYAASDGKTTRLYRRPMEQEQAALVPPEPLGRRANQAVVVLAWIVHPGYPSVRWSDTLYKNPARAYPLPGSSPTAGRLSAPSMSVNVGVTFVVYHGRSLAT